MSYDLENGEISAVYRPDGSVDGVVRPKSAVRFVAPGSVTEGRYSLFRWDMQPQAGGPEPHFHRTFSEAFYIMSGTVRLYNGREWEEAQAGDYLYVPEGGIHAFSNDSGEHASMLVLYAPGTPRERFFTASAELANSGRELTPEEWTTFLAEHDQYTA